MPRKFNPHDRMLLAGMLAQGHLAHGFCNIHDCTLSGPARDAVERADALLTALAETPSPACVDPDGYGPMASLERAMNTAFRHMLGDLANLQGRVK